MKFGTVNSKNRDPESWKPLDEMKNNKILKPDQTTTIVYKGITSKYLTKYTFVNNTLQISYI